MNNASIDHGINELVSVDIPESWLTAEDTPVQQEKPAFIRDVVDVMNRQEGNSLPVSTMVKYGLADGTWPAGTSKFEKRGAAVEVPAWDSSKCLQCNQCALVCPPCPLSVPFCWTRLRNLPSPPNLRLLPLRA